MNTLSASQRFSALYQELAQLHKAYVRRDGSPLETKRQARFAVIDAAEILHADLLPGADAAGNLATYIGAMLAGQDTLPAETADSVARLFADAVAIPEVAESRHSTARIAEMAVRMDRRYPQTRFRNALTAAQEAGVKAALAGARDKTCAGDIDRLLRAASALDTVSLDTFMFRSGIGASTLLPFKHKGSMHAKALRCNGTSRLLSIVRELPLTRVDAVRLLGTFADEGFYDHDTAQALCKAFTAMIHLATPRDVARATYFAGVLHHRHGDQALWCQHIKLKSLNPDIYRELLLGLGMLQFPLRTLRAVDLIEDGAWLFSRREPPMEWWVDIVFGMRALHHVQPKFGIHACRHLLTQIHKMDEHQLLKMLFAAGSPEDWKDVPEAMKPSVKKVDRVRDILLMKLKERDLPPALLPVFNAAAAAAGSQRDRRQAPKTLFRGPTAS